MSLVHGLTALPEAAATVAIAGGGPSGLYLALRLARAGIDSVVVDPRAEVDPFRPRAKTTNARTMTLLRGIGLAEAVRSAAALDVSYSQDVIFGTGLRGHELRRFHGAFQLIDGDYELQPECGQQIPQPEVERVLRAAAEASPHITLVTGVSATGVDLESSGPESSRLLLTAAGDTDADDATDANATASITARWIIGADGGTSRVRKSLGIGLQGTSAPRPNVNVVFTSARLREAVTLDPAVQWWVVGEEVSGMIGELDRSGTWWTILQGRDPIDDPAEAADTIRTLAGVGDDVDIEVLSTDAWTARMLLADSYGATESGRRVFLVGDAAHLNPPWGGHGFNTCISDAENLAWKLIAVARGWAADELLNSYEAERRPVAARMIGDAAANGKALAFDFVDSAMAEDSPAGAAARERIHAALSVKTSEFHSEGLVLGYEYSGTACVADGPAPFVDPIEYRPQGLPGCLLPHFWLADGRSVYEASGGEPVRGPDAGEAVSREPDRGEADVAFTLFSLEEPDKATPSTGRSAGAEELLACAAAHGIPLRHVRLSGEDARTAEDLWSASAVLVRPDQHIVTTSASPPASPPAFASALLTACGLDTDPGCDSESGHRSGSRHDAGSRHETGYRHEKGKESA